MLAARSVNALSCVLIALLLPACERGRANTPTATVTESQDVESQQNPTTEPPSSTENLEAADSYEIPGSIDAAYLQRVLQALYNAEGEAGRLIVSSGSVSQSAVEILNAIYDPTQVAERVDTYRQQVAEGLPDTLRPPGNVSVSVTEVIYADRDCAFVAGLRDFSAVVVEPRDRTGERDYFQLLPVEPGQDPNGHNPTPWVIGGSVVRGDQSQPENPCAS